MINENKFQGYVLTSGVRHDGGPGSGPHPGAGHKEKKSAEHVVLNSFDDFKKALKGTRFENLEENRARLAFRAVGGKGSSGSVDQLVRSVASYFNK